MRVFVADWDETITVADTTSLVADTAYSNKTGLPEFDTFARIYVDALRNYDLQYMAVHGERDTLEHEIAYQRGLHAVEMTSISAMVECGIFTGLTRNQFESQAVKVQLRPGFVEFADRLYKEGIPMYILSINWSKTIIEESLRIHDVQGFTVLANDLEFVDGVCTGRFNQELDIRTGYDKMEQLRKIQELHEDHSVVYVGDSGGDVLPLRTSCIGIIIAGGRAASYVRHVRQLKGYNHLDCGVYEGSWEDLDQAW